MLFESFFIHFRAASWSSNLSFGFSYLEVPGDFERISSLGGERNVETSTFPSRERCNAPKGLEPLRGEPKTQVSIGIGS